MFACGRGGCGVGMKLILFFSGHTLRGERQRERERERERERAHTYSHITLGSWTLVLNVALHRLCARDLSNTAIRACSANLCVARQGHLSSACEVGCVWHTFEVSRAAGCWGKRS